MNGIRDQNFVFTFSAYIFQFWLKIMPGRSFIIFWIFLLFFWNFLARVEYERNPGLKFRFHIFGLSHPVWARNNAGNRFYNFLNFYTILFGIFFPGSSMNGNWDWNYFFTFSAYIFPFWLEIMPGICFIIFWIFLLLFSEFSCPGRVWTEFGTKILFSLFRPISSRFG